MLTKMQESKEEQNRRFRLADDLEKIQFSIEDKAKNFDLDSIDEIRILLEKLIELLEVDI